MENVTGTDVPIKKCRFGGLGLFWFFNTHKRILQRQKEMK